MTPTAPKMKEPRVVGEARWPWNKIAMMAQSAISLVLLGLVIARAVNVLR